MAEQHELREKGLRLTPQRELVLTAVRELGHATPEEVADKVRQTHPGINLSTVYRTLEVLEQVGLVTHAHIGHGAPTYHVVDDTPHIHLVCSRCRKVESIDGDDFAKYANKLENDNGFVIKVPKEWAKANPLTQFGLEKESADWAKIGRELQIQIF